MMKNKISFVVAALAGTVSSANASNLHHDISNQVPPPEGGEQSIIADTEGYTNALESSETISYTNAAVYSSLEIVAPKPIKWDRSAERKFKTLAIKAALGNISAEEKHFLKLLEHEMESQAYPPDPEEVMLTYRKEIATENLISALREYVKYVIPKGKDHPKRKA